MRKHYTPPSTEPFEIRKSLGISKKHSNRVLIKKLIPSTKISFGRGIAQAFKTCTVTEITEKVNEIIDRLNTK